MAGAARRGQVERASRQEPGPGGSEGRLLWADVAKGASILLVVLHHLVRKHYDVAMPADLSGLASGWVSMTDALRPLRMPLFFILSGCFAASALHRPWRDVLVGRAVTPYYLYAVWLSIHAALFVSGSTMPMNRTRSGQEWIMDLAFPSTGVWYLYALAAYFLVAKLLRAIDRRIVVAAALALALAVTELPIDFTNRQSVLQHFVYFAVGAYFPQAVRRMSGLRHWAILPGLALLYVAFAALLSWRGAPEAAVVGLSVIAVPLGIAATVALCRLRRVAAVTAFVGRRTLPIYVLHVPVLAVVHNLVMAAPVASRPPWMAAAAAVYPGIATVAIVAACLLAHMVLVRVGLGWLFVLPRVSRGSAATPSEVVAGQWRGPVRRRRAQLRRGDRSVGSRGTTAIGRTRRRRMRDRSQAIVSDEPSRSA